MKLSKETQDLIQECKIKNKQYRDSYSIKERNKITRELSELTNNIKDALSKEIPDTLHVTVSKDIDISYYFEEIITGMIEFDLSIEQAIKDAVEYEKIEVIDEDDIKIEYGNLEGVSTKLTEEEKERRIKKFES